VPENSVLDGGVQRRLDFWRLSHQYAVAVGLVDFRSIAALASIRRPERDFRLCVSCQDRVTVYHRKIELVGLEYRGIVAIR
jgi:hypothetical protein